MTGDTDAAAGATDTGFFRRHWKAVAAVIGVSMLTAIRAMNMFRRQEDLAFDTDIKYEIGQSRVEHHNEDKDWYYRDDILITITKHDSEAADDGGDG